MAFEEGDWVDFMLGNLDKSPSAKSEVTENHALVTAENRLTSQSLNATSNIFAVQEPLLPQNNASLFLFDQAPPSAIPEKSNFVFNPTPTFFLPENTKTSTFNQALAPLLPQENKQSNFVFNPSPTPQSSFYNFKLLSDRPNKPFKPKPSRDPKRATLQLNFFESKASQTVPVSSLPPLKTIRK
ncbi:MAG TPA: hypothetical protein DCG13_00765 [Legionellales bacterium]|nr:hypothetical protein [Legionellales bacterium]HCA89976.1 hypothetical protein [Legionellales bacterium]|tara:strand:+ start:1502 stop:2053 length:552 start_codon:yes stop_codon:yes gene_type:complete